MYEQILKILQSYIRSYGWLDCEAPDAAKEITSMVMEFIEWTHWEDENDDFHFIKDYTTNQWLNADKKMESYDTDALFEYWINYIRKP